MFRQKKIVNYTGLIIANISFANYRYVIRLITHLQDKLNYSICTQVHLKRNFLEKHTVIVQLLGVTNH